MKKILISNVEIVTDSPAYKKKYIGITGNKISYIACCAVTPTTWR